MNLGLDGQTAPSCRARAHITGPGPITALRWGRNEVCKVPAGLNALLSLADGDMLAGHRVCITSPMGQLAISRKRVVLCFGARFVHKSEESAVDYLSSGTVRYATLRYGNLLVSVHRSASSGRASF